jgi:DNA repair protein RadC
MEKCLLFMSPMPVWNEFLFHFSIIPSQRIKITSSFDAEKVFRKIWCKPIELRECFYALFLNRANMVLGYYLISVGGITGTVVDPRCIFQAALKASATGILLAHNHPSGSPTPSDADNNITRKIKEAGDILEIKLLDHLILLPEGYTSMAGESPFLYVEIWSVFRF